MNYLFNLDKLVNRYYNKHKERCQIACINEEDLLSEAQYCYYSHIGNPYYLENPGYLYSRIVHRLRDLVKKSLRRKLCELNSLRVTPGKFRGNVENCQSKLPRETVYIIEGLTEDTLHREVLYLKVQHKTHREISQELGISYYKVRKIINLYYDKVLSRVY